MDDVYPAGKFWCPRCVQRQDFILADGSSPTDVNAPVECWACGYVYDTVTEEWDPKTGLSLDNPMTRPALTVEQRVRAREEMLREFRESMLLSGTRRNALLHPPRKGR